MNVISAQLRQKKEPIVVRIFNRVIRVYFQRPLLRQLFTIDPDNVERICRKAIKTVKRAKILIVYITDNQTQIIDVKDESRLRKALERYYFAGSDQAEQLDRLHVNCSSCDQSCCQSRLLLYEGSADPTDRPEARCRLRKIGWTDLRGDPVFVAMRHNSLDD